MNSADIDGVDRTAEPSGTGCAECIAGDVETEQLLKGPELAPPRWRPESQPVPAPAELVPADWKRRLHR